MSTPRFASITASLLARKGEAQPWAEQAKKTLAWDVPLAGEPLRAWDPPAFTQRPALVTPRPAPQPAATPSQPAVAPPQHAPSHGTEAPQDYKKCAVRMSHHDYERLGILAVKQGKTRQRLLQEAVDSMLNGITKTFGSGCACLGAEKCPPKSQCE